MKFYHATVTPRVGVEPDEDQVGMLKMEVLFSVGDMAQARFEWGQSKSAKITAQSVMDNLLTDLHLQETCYVSQCDELPDANAEDPESWIWK